MCVRSRIFARNIDTHVLDDCLCLRAMIHWTGGRLPLFVLLDFNNNVFVGRCHAFVGNASVPVLASDVCVCVCVDGLGGVGLR